MDSDKILAAADGHPCVPDVTYKYGTAGFRTKASVLDPVLFRVGLLACLRSIANSGKAVGVMVTASHNPEADNGAKIVDPLGDMMDQAWESPATALANTPNAAVAEKLAEIAAQFSVPLGDGGVRPVVVVGRDTRPSSESLTQACIDACNAMGAEVVDLGVVTTPQVHFVVRCKNDPSYGTASVDGYHEKLANAFKKFFELCGASEPVRLTVDCANGVGAAQFRQLLPLLKGQLSCTLINDGSDGVLNLGCGADFVKTNQAAPENSGNVGRFASFDGDADRIVYYFFDESGNFVLLDGDRIAALAGVELKSLCTQAGLNFNIGVVQTAYANGSSTKCIKETANLPVALAKTGVKHLHHEALNFDIGVYFEANGHGTVLFSTNAIEQIQSASATTEEAQKALDFLRCYLDLINQTVGDAISDLLLVEAILMRTYMDEAKWNAMYVDLPNKLMKVKIADRSIVTTTNAETTCVTPEGLQDAIDALVAKYNSARSFVRPSGTEDVVRVYAEAATKEEVDALSKEVAKAVYDMAGGIGDLSL